MSYAICCKNCGNVVSTALVEDKGQKGQWLKSTEPLTPRGRVHVICQQCGAQDWRVPATAEDITKFEAMQHRAVRAAELCKSLDIDGLLKVPEDVRASPEVKNALSNLFGPLEGETLKLAQSLVLKVARSGVVVAADVWVDMYDRAVTKAIQETKKSAKVTA